MASIKMIFGCVKSGKSRKVAKLFKEVDGAYFFTPEMRAEDIDIILSKYGSSLTEEEAARVCKLPIAKESPIIFLRNVVLDKGIKDTTLIVDGYNILGKSKMNEVIDLAMYFNLDLVITAQTPFLVGEDKNTQEVTIWRG